MSAEADTQAATEAGLAAAAGMDDNEGAEILLAMLGLAPEGAQKQARGLGGGEASGRWEGRYEQQSLVLQRGSGTGTQQTAGRSGILAEPCCRAVLH